MKVRSSVAKKEFKKNSGFVNLNDSEHEESGNEGTYLNFLEDSSDEEPKKKQKNKSNKKNGSKSSKKRSLKHDSDEDEPVTTKKSKKDEGEDANSGELAANQDFIGFDFSESENEADEDEEEEDYSTRGDGKVSVNNQFPWILNHDHSTQKEIADWLSLEILDFVSYISPSKKEIRERNGCISRLTAAIESFWRDSHVYVFGSYATDLYLPHSDIDMVIKTDDPDSGYLKDNRSSLYKLANYLKGKQIVHDVQVIAHAKVPIIKLVESVSNIHVDISFERSNGIDAARIIKEWLDTTPAMRELTLIVKHFLSTRKLNDVHLGGLGGFSTICLVYTFLKLHPRLSTTSMDPIKNIGVLLIEFFELYGKNFGYDNVIVAPVCKENNGAPGYLNKMHYPALQGRNPFQLTIQDPSDPANNISRGSFNIRDLKKAFTGAFELLVNKCFELESKTYKARINQSILGNIIKYKGETRDFVDERGLVKNVAAIENQIFYYEQDARRPLISDRTTDYVDLDESEDQTKDSDGDGSSESDEDEDFSDEEDDDASQDSSDDEESMLKKISYDDSDNDDSHVTMAGKASHVSVDNLMGLSDDDQSASQVYSPLDKTIEKKPEGASKSAKRDYWSRKGSLDFGQGEQ
ncbi:non-canonical poly(A) polymerase [Saccharomycopsis crataegensis]|uniref:polynucleotide adenylyltransferase n=1 Tax=Saccharomycopsis crataegensis TaxID=43959 RepID=A0AAV5QTD1_9ASCO|nr:non-canonical poly(A) polymerase [Saccharomycopsis crataegensis]